ncbi:MAG: hypothetical protein ABI977_14475 [Acidobacteriota bacterium]
MSEENINSQNPQESASWEARVQTRANEFVNQRIGSLKTEIERLQATITEINSKLSEHSQAAATEQESSGLLDTIKQWFSDSSAKAEESFQARLADAHSEWEASLQESQEAKEVEFQKRLEQACIEAAAVARRDADTQIEELREQLEASRQALTIAVSSEQSARAQASSSDYLKSAIEDIDAQRTQSDTLTTLVRRAAQFAPRVVFFVVKGGDAVGWKTAGFENGLNDETVRLLSVPTQNQTLLREALTTFNTAVGRSASPGDNSTVLGLYGSPAPEASVTVPLVVRGKAAAVLYADSGTQSENSINTPALEALLRVASMGIELLPARRGIEPVRPSGPPAQISSSSAAPAVAPAVSAPLPPPAGITAPQPSVTPPPDEPVTAEAQSDEAARTTQDAQDDFADSAAPEEAVVPDRVTEDLQKAEVVQEESHASRPTLFEPAPEPVAEAPAIEPIREDSGFQPAAPPPPPTPPVFASPSLPNDLTPPKVEPTVIPPAVRTVEPSFAPPVFTPPVQPAFTTPAPETLRPAQPVMSVPAPTSETEQRAHNDARRFARLLVSEIKLYNAAKVNEGRRSFDLYDRLKDEIDRSRKVYDKRVSPAVATRFDYFYDELVQTLAEGDTNKLGPNCPGPIVLG